MTELVEESIHRMKKDRNFTTKQIDFVKKYDRNLDMKGLSKATRASRIQRLFQIFETVGKDFEDITEKDIENYIYKLKDRGVTSYTVENWKCVIRGFFKGTPIEKAQCLERGKFKYPKKTSKDLLTEEQVKRIIETEPDGDNGWYVSNVTVMFNATDDMSGVNVTYYRISFGAWCIYTEPFAFGAANFIIDYYSVDNAGNEEDVKSSGLYIDQKPPSVYVGLDESWYDIFINVTAEDQHHLSGMNRVEFYFIDDYLQETVYGPGPVYRWKWNETNLTEYKTSHVRGLILNPQIIDQNITFFCIIVFISEHIPSPEYSYAIGYDNAGNWEMDDFFPDITAQTFVGFPKLILFQQVTLPMHYNGFLGKYFVNAWFYSPLWPLGLDNQHIR